jgi:hypothetical protein
LKFVRHLGALGWQAVVLADLETAASDPTLGDAIPESTVVARDYAWGSARRERRALQLRAGPAETDRPLAAWRSALGRLTAPLTAPFDRNPELVPLGEHALDIPHALAAARRLLDRHSCEVIVVNADPYAACLVGQRLAEERRLPLIVDLRDPWALCELRRPMRQGPQRALVDRMERRVVERSSFVVLNTETTRGAYANHYRDLSEDRFRVIRNHADRSLMFRADPGPPQKPFELLVLGHLRRFIAGETLLEALTECRQRGLDEQRLRLNVVGSAPSESLDRARELGILDMIRIQPPRPYRSIPSTIEEADLLVAVGHPGQQRIPAKIYDYAISPRPFAVVSDSLEIRTLLEPLAGASTVPLADRAGLARLIEAEVERGKRRSVARETRALESPQAAADLAELLDRASRG